MGQFQYLDVRHEALQQEMEGKYVETQEVRRKNGDTISKEVIMEAIRTLKSHKARENDKIIAEIVKNMGAFRNLHIRNFKASEEEKYKMNRKYYQYSRKTATIKGV